MLTQIREKIVGPIGLVILGAIALSFVFFGATLNFAGNVYAAKVDGSEIGLAEFENTYRQQLNANPQLAQLPPEFRGQFRQNILESMIRERLVELYLEEAGYQVSEVQLTAAIQRVPDFQINGVFDLDTAETLLAQNGLTTATFRNAQRNRLRVEQLRRAIGGTSLVTPSDYRRYLNLVAEQRLVSIATFVNEKSAEAAGIKYNVWTEEFKDNDRSLAEGETIGKIKMLLDEKEKPIGVQILGPHAGDLISEWVAVLNGKVKLSTLAAAIHPYPTIGEINKKVAGTYFSPKIFSEKVQKGLKFFFHLKGRACAEDSCSE